MWCYSMTTRVLTLRYRLDDKCFVKLSLQYKKQVRAQAPPDAASDAQEVHAEAGAEDVATEAASIVIGPFTRLSP
jgi:hypothetical protein